MEKFTQHTNPNKSWTQQLGILVYILIVFSLTIFFVIKGAKIDTILIQMFDFLLPLFLFVVYFKIITLFVVNGKTTRYLGLLFFLTPIIDILTEASPYSFYKYYRNYPYLVCYTIELVLLIYLYIICSTRANASVFNKNTGAPSSGINQTDYEMPSSEDLLGQGSGKIDTVISSINYRAVLSLKTMRTSLVVMVIIVFVGGGFSIASEAFSEFGAVRQLEQERTHLVNIAATMNQIKTLSHKLDMGDTSFNLGVDTITSQQIDKLTQAVLNQYGDDKSYKETITALRQDLATSWQDIAMKITIAILTLFLVQVFFNIYKYNQQQVSHLFSKAETIELYKEAKDEHYDLRKELMKKIETAPRFEKGPTPPTEQIIGAFEKLKK